MTDVDDIGALAVANVLHNCGLCDLQGVMINTGSKYGGLAANVVNTYFGNSQIPIAALRPLTNDMFFDQQTYILGEYASKVAHNWPRSIDDPNETPEPVDLYRSLLVSAKNGSVTIISIGFLTNLAALLDTIDGPELISNKVKELVVMGGRYPSGWEYNFGGSDPVSTAKAINNWPRNIPITFSGYELGANVFSGQALRQHAPRDSPVLAAYEWYMGRCNTVRESWDPITVLYGILGLEGFDALGLEAPFAYANERGYNSVALPDGSNAWVDDPMVTNQHWLRLAEGVSNVSLAALLTQMYARGPGLQSCF